MAVSFASTGPQTTRRAAMVVAATIAMADITTVANSEVMVVAMARDTAAAVAMAAVVSSPTREACLF